MRWEVWSGLDFKHVGRVRQQAAEEAANDTKDAIGRHLLIIDLERSINLIQRLTLLHSSGRWEASLEQYQALRAMISSIIARYPGDGSEFCERLSEARTSITMMESRVESRRGRGMETDVVTELNDQLRNVQRDLEEMSSTMGLGD